VTVRQTADSSEFRTESLAVRLERVMKPDQTLMLLVWFVVVSAVEVEDDEEEEGWEELEELGEESSKYFERRLVRNLPKNFSRSMVVAAVAVVRLGGTRGAVLMQAGRWPTKRRL
jgi:hypothetical protein